MLMLIGSMVKIMVGSEAGGVKPEAQHIKGC